MAPERAVGSRRSPWSPWRAWCAAPSGAGREDEMSVRRRLIALHLGEGLAGRRVTLGVRDVRQADHAAQLAFAVAHHDAGLAVLAHETLRLGHVAAQPTADEVAGRKTIDGIVCGAALRQHADGQIAVGDGADGRSLVIADRHEPDVLLLHQTGALLHGRTLPAALRLAHQLVHLHMLLLVETDPPHTLGSAGARCNAVVAS